MKLCQITDTHLLENSSDTLWNLNLDETLSKVIEKAKADQPGLVVFTGDCSQDGSIDSYKRLTDYFKEFDCPVNAIHGNHDDAKQFERYLDLPKEKVLEFESWQLIFLDSVLPGKIPGYLSDNEVSFLNNNINPEKHVMVLMHHHPIPVNPMADRYMVENYEAFLKTCGLNPSIKSVVFGHIHCAFDLEKNGVRFLGAPSTCVNFQSSSEDLQHLKGNLNPGYRILELLDDGTIKTYVKRI